MQAKFLEQLDSILVTAKGMRKSSRHSDLSDIPEHDRKALVTRALSAIARISGDKSSYSREARRVIQQYPHLHMHAVEIFGVVEALRGDVADGYVSTIVELVHADVFSDFLEMADHLCNGGYKLASAVIVGAALEGHIRALCAKHAIAVEEKRSDGSVLAKKADRLNSELASEGAYGKLDQKSVTAWLDLRNKAAHGKETEFTSEQVNLMLSGVRDFITRTPA